MYQIYKVGLAIFFSLNESDLSLIKRVWLVSIMVSDKLSLGGPWLAMSRLELRICLNLNKNHHCPCCYFIYLLPKIVFLMYEIYKLGFVRLIASFLLDLNLIRRVWLVSMMNSDKLSLGRCWQTLSRLELLMSLHRNKYLLLSLLGMWRMLNLPWGMFEAGAFFTQFYSYGMNIHSLTSKYIYSN